MKERSKREDVSPGVYQGRLSPSGPYRIVVRIRQCTIFAPNRAHLDLNHRIIASGGKHSLLYQWKLYDFLYKIAPTALPSPTDSITRESKLSVVSYEMNCLGRRLLL